MAQPLSSFDISKLGLGNVGLQEKNGQIVSNVLQQSNPIANPINFGYNTPVVATQITPPQQQQQNNNSGGGSNYGATLDAMKKGQMRWDDNLLASLHQAEAPKIDFDAIYNPQFDALNQQEQFARSDADIQQQQLADSATRQEGKVDEQIQSANQVFDTQRNKTSQQQQEQNSQMQRDLLAMRQRAGFLGSGSSLGGAVNQIGEQEYFKNLGKSNSEYTNVFGDINNQQNEVVRKATSTKNDIEDWLKNSKVDVMRDLNKTIMTINNSRAQLGVSKAQQIVNAKNYAADVINQRETMAYQANLQLKQWTEQQNFILTNQLAPIYQNYQAQSVAPQQMSTFNPTTTQNQQGLQNLKFNPQTNKFEDPYGQVVS